jgi:hypothetical protein
MKNSIPTFIDIDPLIVSERFLGPNEFYRNGLMIMQLRTEYRMLSLEKHLKTDILTIKLEKVFEPHPNITDNLADLVFTNVLIKEIGIEGGLDDYSQLESISLTNDNANGYLFWLELSNSGFILYSADSMRLLIGDETTTAQDSNDI